MSNQSGVETGQTSPKPPKRPDAEQGADSIDELVGRLREAEGVSDDMAQAIAENWQRVLGGVVCIMVGVWLYGSYQEREIERNQKASELYSSIQTQVSEINSEMSEEERTSSFARIESNLKLLNEGYADSSYNELGELLSSIGISKTDAASGSQSLEPLIDQVASRPADYLANLAAAPNSDILAEIGALAAVRAKASVATDNSEIFSPIASIADKTSLITSELLLIAIRLDDNEGQKLAKESLAKISTINAPHAQQVQEALQRAGFDLN